MASFRRTKNHQKKQRVEEMSPEEKFLVAFFVFFITSINIHFENKSIG